MLVQLHLRTFEICVFCVNEEIKDNSMKTILYSHSIICVTETT